MAKRETIKYYQGELIDDMKAHNLKLALKKMIRQAQRQRENHLRFLIDARLNAPNVPEIVPNLDNVRTNK